MLSGKDKSGILPKDLLSQMHQIQFTDSLSNQKGSWFWNLQQNNENLVGHGGSCPGYKTQLTLDPKGKRRSSH